MYDVGEDDREDRSLDQRQQHRPDQTEAGAAIARLEVAQREHS
jgi:hypothetical protein